MSAVARALPAAGLGACLANASTRGRPRPQLLPTTAMGIAVLILMLGVGACTSANVATVATSASGDLACADACKAPSCQRVAAAVVTGGGEMIAVREETHDIVLFRFAGDDVKGDVVARLSCMGAPVVERRPDGVYASCTIPPAEVRVPARLTTPSPARMTHDASTRIDMGPRSVVVLADACFAPKRDGLVTCEPAGHCFVYSMGQLRSVVLR